jgi:hypothetical protein
MEKEIVIGNRKILVRELLAKDVDTIDFNNKVESNRKQVTLSTGLTNDEYDRLTWNERTKIIEAINEVNGLKDFLIPAK